MTHQRQYVEQVLHHQPLTKILLQLCTTAFLIEISQYIRIGDLTGYEGHRLTNPDTEPTLPPEQSANLPSFSMDELEGPELVPRLTDTEEDALLKVITPSTCSRT